MGYLHFISDDSDSSVYNVYWKALAMNALGQVIDEETRNGVQTVGTRNPSTGWMLGQTATAHADSDNLIQGLTNKFDEVGNLLSRGRSEPRDMADSKELLGYDDLDRLKSSEVNTAGYHMSETFDYDGLGNLTLKGSRQYLYSGCGGRPHAVCQAGSTTYSYDSAGNVTNASLSTVGSGKVITYNAANKVRRITDHPDSPSNDTRTTIVDFAYSGEGNRVVQSVGTDLKSDLARTVYVGLGGTGKGLYERTTKKSNSGQPTSVEHVNFIYAAGAHGGNAFALQITTEDGSGGETDVSMKYNHFDHLGSVTAMSDGYGRVLGPSWGGPEATVMGYDAWGARRNADGTPTASAPALQTGHREFTGHETIPGVGLVNMNGRVYDPELGRFLAPDPNVQFAGNLQSYNR